jgi:acyl carrier protein
VQTKNPQGKAAGTPMNPEEQVVSVLARRSGLAKEQLTPETRLVEDLKLDGDDAVDALLEISKKCSIDVSGFDSSLYFRSEPTLLSLFRFLPSQKKRSIQKQTITVADLVDAARRGSWQSR